MRGFHTKKQLLVCFLPLFFIGILCANFSAGKMENTTDVFSEYYLAQYKSTDIVFGEYLIYLLRIRMVSAASILALSFTKFRKVAAWGFTGWTGFLGGFVMALAVIGMGIKGSLLCIVGLFPHCICYVLAYFVILWYAVTYPQIRWNSQKTIFVLGALLLGVILEAYINPVLMRGFIGIL